MWFDIPSVYGSTDKRWQCVVGERQPDIRLEVEAEDGRDRGRGEEEDPEHEDGWRPWIAEVGTDTEMEVADSGTAKRDGPAQWRKEEDKRVGDTF